MKKYLFMFVITLIIANINSIRQFKLDKEVVNTISLDKSIGSLRINKLSVLNDGCDKHIIENSYQLIDSDSNTEPDKKSSKLLYDPPVIKESPKNIIYKHVFGTDHPQYYKECNVKEGDALFERSDIALNTGNSPFVPVRLTMTVDSIKIRLSPSTTLFEIKLEDIKNFFKDKSNTSCFYIKNKLYSTYKFCELNGNNVPRSTADEWIEDINTFISECRKLVNNNCEEDIKSLLNQVYKYNRESELLIRKYEANKYSLDRNKVFYLKKTIESFDDLASQIELKMNIIKICRHFVNLNLIKMFKKNSKIIRSKKIYKGQNSLKRLEKITNNPNNYSSVSVDFDNIDDFNIEIKPIRNIKDGDNSVFSQKSIQNVISKLKFIK